MKKFILGLSFGLAIACSSVAFASGSIQALLFPVSFEMNGSNIGLNNDYKVLNVDGHAYVPIRFIAENLGATIDYDTESQKIFVKNRNLDITDPDYKGILVGNLILTKVGINTKVTGQLKMEGVGNTKNMIGASLSFYNDKSEKIGDIAINGNEFGVDAQTFVSEGSGDFRAYSAVNLHIGVVNNQIVSEAPSIVYENNKHNFTLKLPKTWEGNYEVVNIVNEDSGTDNYHFIDKTNKDGYGGVIFTISIWTKEEWIKNGPTAIEIGQIYKIGEDGDNVFTLSPPGDVEYDPHDEKLKAQYSSMSNQINKIKTSFKLKN
ncbi:Copper amine oxidase N-terminal domain-containing protein [Paenibacillus sp. 1_12]|uniref:stalk domain-containing protein n=1 Tax=Paenibacillus sp. 1_12 TaxID=1566278 RepID=UPI0008ECFE1E|nr:stalk domain-containing protein [Paenibacillus sp. 1_12]SFL42752.1 Copper amine oxidase N-terminal domain-containing protein [Paenibacillus sp. 1_12]